MLEREPSLTGLTLLEKLDDLYPGTYGGNVLRTLQRLVKKWKALQGPDRPVIFRQLAEPGHMGLSDFTHPVDTTTDASIPFNHLLYQIRLAFSGWRSVTVIQDGESYAFLAADLQRALKSAGSCPRVSLSAAFYILQSTWSGAYEDLCQHYHNPSRNIPGQSHEHGTVEYRTGSAGYPWRDYWSASRGCPGGAQHHSSIGTGLRPS